MAVHNVIQRGKCISNMLHNVAMCFELKTPRLLAPSSKILQIQSKKRGVTFHTTTKIFDTQEHVNEAIVSNEVVEGEGPSITSLRKRGLYSDYRYGHYHKYKVTDLSISEDQRKVDVKWNDNHVSRFDAIWLRHQCHCVDCKHDTNGFSSINWDDLPLDICVLSAKLEDDKILLVTWGTPDGKTLHEGAIPVATLRCYCYSDKAIKDRRQKRAMKLSKETDIPEFQYEEVTASEQALHKLTTVINDRGVCVVKNVKRDWETFKKTIQLLGPIQETLYGETFEVFSSPNPVNLAYSSRGLDLHMDLTFYESPPGLQILHCWRFDKEIEGGNNIFVDIYEVAHRFRTEHPELFDRLAKYPININSIHYNRTVPVHYEYQGPIFSLNHLGELMSVRWHPLIQGPTELPEKDMILFYEAFTTFYKMVSQFEITSKFRFSEGDFVIFNNRRVLHAREAFQGPARGRHLVGGYVNLCDFHSLSQALHNKYGNGRLSSRSGSNSWF